jgi:hypothetical protein
MLTVKCKSLSQMNNKPYAKVNGYALVNLLFLQPHSTQGPLIHIKQTRLWIKQNILPL